MDADLSTDSESSDCDTDKYDRKNRQAGQYSFHNYESNSLRIITVRRKMFKIWQYLSSLWCVIYIFWYHLEINTFITIHLTKNLKTSPECQENSLYSKGNLLQSELSSSASFFQLSKKKWKKNFFFHFFFQLQLELWDRRTSETDLKMTSIDSLFYYKQISFLNLILTSKLTGIGRIWFNKILSAYFATWFPAKKENISEGAES